jgi:hypothetical protein
MYTFVLTKLVDFLYNLSVASIAVSAFQGVWYGAIVALFAFLCALVISFYVGGNQ